MKRLLSSVGILVAVAPAAFAQSLSGPYVGAQFGYETGDADLSLQVPGFPSPFADSMDYDGWDVGAYAGYRWAPGPTFFLGGEIGGSWVDADGSKGNPFGFDDADFQSSASLEKNDEYYITMQAGALVQPNTLVYLLGGFQMADFDASVNLVDFGVPSSFSNGDRLNGLHVGIGAEYFFNSSWSARGEYRYQDFDDITVTDADGNRINFDPDESVLRLGVSYRF